MLCDVIYYNDVISATDSLEFVKDVRFSDVQTVENINVKYVEAGNFWDDPRNVNKKNKFSKCSTRHFF